MPLLGYIKNNKKVKNAYYLDIIGTPITYQDFMQLTPAQQENGNWYVTGMSPMVNAYSIMYKNGLSIGQTIDELNAEITKHIYGTPVNLSGYSSSNMYVVPVDGYFEIFRHSSNSGSLTGNIKDNNGVAISISTTTGARNAIFVRAGFNLYPVGLQTNDTARFIPFE